MIPGLTFVRDLSWSEAFEIWRKNEECLEKWKEVYERRGFSSWEAWRKDLIAPWNLEARTWKLYKIDQPTKTVSKFHGGPFLGWTERYYNEATAPTFTEIVTHPDIQTVPAFKDFVTNFPSPTTITGVQNDDGIVIIEGMHRCAALVFGNLNPEIYIALADFEPGHLERVGKKD